MANSISNGVNYLNDELRQFRELVKKVASELAEKVSGSAPLQEIFSLLGKLTQLVSSGEAQFINLDEIPPPIEEGPLVAKIIEKIQTEPGELGEIARRVHNVYVSLNSSRIPVSLPLIWAELEEYQQNHPDQDLSYLRDILKDAEEIVLIRIEGDASEVDFA